MQAIRTYGLILVLLLVNACGSNKNGDSQAADWADQATEEAKLAESASLKANKNTKDNSKTGKTWKRSDKTANLGTIFIGDKEQLPLKGSQIAIKVDGFRARVLIDCFFYSDQKWQMEGTFKMKLPQGASPYYFAFGQSVYLDKDGAPSSILPFLDRDKHDFSIDKIHELRSGAAWSQPKVARVVPKEKAAFAYTQTVRRQIDPALAEWAGADIYNCRVFPIMPQQLHRVVFGYDVNLTSLNNDWIFDFTIPEVDCPLVLDVDMATIQGIQTTVNPKVVTRSRSGRTVFRLENPKDQTIGIRYKSLNNIALVNNATLAGADPYVAYSLSPNLPNTASGQVNNQAIIALDISLSSNPDKFNVWLKLAEALLSNNSQQIKEFNVLLFNIESFWWKNKTVKNTPANIQEFLTFANSLVLEGASDINQALNTITTTNWSKRSAESIFLLSDGADTWGEDDSYAMIKNIAKNDRLFAFNTGMSGTSINKLNQLTRASGGALFSITGEDEIAQVSTAFRAKPWKIEAIEAKGNRDIIIAGSPKYLYPGQQMLLTARGNIAQDSKVNLTLSQDGIQKKLPITIKHVVPTSLVRRVYGQYATATLEEFDYLTESQSVAYARHFGVPGKTCSLLMLETEEDYKRFQANAVGDKKLIDASLVNDVVAQVFASIETLLGNPKNKFKSWLERLTKMDGMTFTLSDTLSTLVDAIPASKFVITQPAIQSKSTAKSDLSSSFGEALLESNLDYDIFNKEAQRRLKQYGAADALKALSSLVEKNPGDAVLARDVAYSALEWDLDAQAYFLFKRVLKSRPYEPQTYLAIAKSLAKSGNIDLACIYYEVAISAEWNPRFGEFQRIATLDYLNVLRQAQQKKSLSVSTYAKSRYQELKSQFKEESVDVMVVIAWNTDNTDIDLHVIEPSGEECYYGYRETRIGGYMTQDVTQGYGPEMYILPKAKRGGYDVRVKYFSSNRNRASTRTKIYASVYKNWGTPQETVVDKVVTLADNKQMHDIVEIDF